MEIEKGVDLEVNQPQAKRGYASIGAISITTMLLLALLMLIAAPFADLAFSSLHMQPKAFNVYFDGPTMKIDTSTSLSSSNYFSSASIDHIKCSFDVAYGHGLHEHIGMLTTDGIVLVDRNADARPINLIFDGVNFTALRSTLQSMWKDDGVLDLQLECATDTTYYAYNMVPVTMPTSNHKVKQSISIQALRKTLFPDEQQHADQTHSNANVQDVHAEAPHYTHSLFSWHQGATLVKPAVEAALGSAYVLSLIQMIDGMFVVPIHYSIDTKTWLPASIESATIKVPSMCYYLGADTNALQWDICLHAFDLDLAADTMLIDTNVTVSCATIGSDGSDSCAELLPFLSMRKEYLQSGQLSLAADAGKGGKEPTFLEHLFGVRHESFYGVVHKSADEPTAVRPERVTSAVARAHVAAGQYEGGTKQHAASSTEQECYKIENMLFLGADVEMCRDDNTLEVTAEYDTLSLSANVTTVSDDISIRLLLVDPDLISATTILMDSVVGGYNAYFGSASTLYWVDSNSTQFLASGSATLSTTTSSIGIDVNSINVLRDNSTWFAGNMEMSLELPDDETVAMHINYARTDASPWQTASMAMGLHLMPDDNAVNMQLDIRWNADQIVEVSGDYELKQAVPILLDALKASMKYAGLGHLVDKVSVVVDFIDMPKTLWVERSELDSFKITFTNDEDDSDIFDISLGAVLENCGAATSTLAIKYFRMRVLDQLVVDMKTNAHIRYTKSYMRLSMSSLDLALFEQSVFTNTTGWVYADWSDYDMYVNAAVHDSMQAPLLAVNVEGKMSGVGMVSLEVKDVVVRTNSLLLLTIESMSLQIADSMSRASFDLTAWGPISHVHLLIADWEVTDDALHIAADASVTLPNWIEVSVEMDAGVDFDSGEVTGNADTRSKDLQLFSDYILNDERRANNITWVTCDYISTTGHFYGAVETLSCSFEACPGDILLLTTCQAGRDCICDASVELSLYDSRNVTIASQGAADWYGCTEYGWQVQDDSCQTYAVKSVCTSTGACTQNSFSVGKLDSGLDAYPAHPDISYASVYYPASQYCPAYYSFNFRRPQEKYEAQRCRFRACANQTIEVGMCRYGWGNCIGDPSLTIVDAKGRKVGQNDNYCGNCPYVSFDTDADGDCQEYTISYECDTTIDPYCGGSVQVYTGGLVHLQDNAWVQCPAFYTSDTYINHYSNDAPSCTFEMCQGDTITAQCGNGANGAAACVGDVALRLADRTNMINYIGSPASNISYTRDVPGCALFSIYEGCSGSYVSCYGQIAIKLAKGLAALPRPSNSPTYSTAPTLQVAASSWSPTRVSNVHNTTIVLKHDEAVSCPVYSTSNTYDGTQNTASCSFQICNADIIILTFCSITNSYDDVYLYVMDENGDKVLYSNFVLYDPILDRSGHKVCTTGYIFLLSTACHNYTIIEGCSGQYACTGQVSVAGIYNRSPANQPAIAPSLASASPVASPTAVSYVPTKANITLQYDQWTACPAYGAQNTNYAYTASTVSSCSFQLCYGDDIAISMCGIDDNEECNGDTYLRLYDSVGNQVAVADDGCRGLCSYLTYTRKAEGCARMTLVEGCFSSRTCSGQAMVMISKAPMLVCPSESDPVPTRQPNLAPSKRPTRSPTLTPSNTAAPTAAPSYAPTVAPSKTASPTTRGTTSKPTIVNTRAPTPGVISLQGSMSMTNVNVTALTSSQVALLADSVRAAVATQTGISSSSVQDVTITDGSSSSRRLSQTADQLQLRRNLVSTSSIARVQYVIVESAAVLLQVLAATNPTWGATLNADFSQLTTAFLDILDGTGGQGTEMIAAMISYVQTNGGADAAALTSQLNDAEVQSFLVVDGTPTSAPTSAPKSSQEDSTTVIIIIAVVVPLGVILLVGILAYFMFGSKGAAKIHTQG